MKVEVAVSLKTPVRSASVRQPSCHSGVPKTVLLWVAWSPSVDLSKLGDSSSIADQWLSINRNPAKAQQKRTSGSKEKSCKAPVRERKMLHLHSKAVPLPTLSKSCHFCKSSLCKQSIGVRFRQGEKQTSWAWNAECERQNQPESSSNPLT